MGTALVIDQSNVLKQAMNRSYSLSVDRLKGRIYEG